MLQSYDCANAYQPEQKRAKISDAAYPSWLPMKPYTSDYSNGDASPSAVQHPTPSFNAQAQVSLFDLLQKHSQQRSAR